MKNLYSSGKYCSGHELGVVKILKVLLVYLVICGIILCVLMVLENNVIEM